MEYQRQAATTLGYYNLLTGPVAWRFSTGLQMQYSDNVNLAQNPEADFIFRPDMDAEMLWPVTQNNVLNFSVIAGYSAYVVHPNLSSFFITPGSELSFDVLVGNVVINLHDRPSITENNYDSPTAGANRTYVFLQNTAGTTITWDLDRWVLQGNYDHINYVYLNANQQFPNGDSENMLLSAGARFYAKIVTGIEGGGSLINYGQSSVAAVPNAIQWNAGAFCKAPITDYISARLDLGYTTFQPDGAVSANFGHASIMYFQFSIQHQINQFIGYSLSAGRSADLEFNGQPYEYNFVQFQANWNIFKDCKLSTPCWWRQGTEIYDPSVNFNQYSINANLTRTLTQKLSGTIGYQFIQETSNQSDLNYIANIVSLSFVYQF